MPVLLIVIGLAIATGRLAHARVSVQQWADSAARSASVARTESKARADAHAVVATDSAHTDVRCRGGARLQLDTGAFGTTAGTAGTVRAHVTCVVPLTDLVPGLPGAITVEGDSSSTLDRYRGRR